ncbi:MAG: cation transporter [Clostridia bacterium]|nr:cation transporter [Clostridia bacterium]
MIKTVLKIEGMMCPMCEAHVAGALRGAFPVKDATASHKAGTCTLTSEAPLSEERLTAVVSGMGYTVLSVTVSEEEKRGLFGRRRK